MYLQDGQIITYKIQIVYRYIDRQINGQIDTDTDTDTDRQIDSCMYLQSPVDD